MAGCGMTQEQIQQYYWLTGDQWRRLIKKYADLEKAFFAGKAKTINMVAGKLMTLIQQGDKAAIFFYLKTQGRWRETDKPGETDSEKPKIPAIMLNVSDPLEAAKIYQEIMLRS